MMHLFDVLIQFESDPLRIMLYNVLIWFKLYFYCITYDNDIHDDNNTDFTYNKDSEVSQLRLL